MDGDGLGDCRQGPTLVALKVSFEALSFTEALSRRSVSRFSDMIASLETASLEAACLLTVGVVSLEIASWRTAKKHVRCTSPAIRKDETQIYHLAPTSNN